MLSTKLRSFSNLLAVCAVVVTLLVGAAIAPAEPGIKRVTVNKPFEISVESNPSTGYQWTAEFDSNFIQMTSSKFERDPSKPKHYVGVGGVTKFVFVPIKTGQTTIRLLYQRPWEDKPIKERVFEIVITS